MSNQTPILTDLSGGRVQYYRLNADHSVSPCLKTRALALPVGVRFY